MDFKETGPGFMLIMSVVLIYYEFTLCLDGRRIFLCVIKTICSVLLQVETFQAKRRREVQLSKAGLRLPTNNQPIKRKNNDYTSKYESQSKRLHQNENCDVSSFKDPLIGDREFRQVDSSIRGSSFVDVGRCETSVQFTETSFENCEMPVPLNQENVLSNSVFTVPKVDKAVVRFNISN